MNRGPMISRLRLLILVNWKEEGEWSFLRYLKKAGPHVEVLQPFSFKSAFGGKLTYLSNYLSEFYVPFLALLRRKNFDVIISWQMRLGICYGILKRIVHSHNPPVHIIQDFHIDLTQTRWRYRLQIALLKFAIPGIDYFFCTSTEEEAIYSQLFHIPRERIVFLPLSESPPNVEQPGHPVEDYIFSYGKSDRDYDTLIRSVAPLKMKTCILSKTYKPQVPVPENVSIIRDRISESELVRWISSSRMVVLSLNDYRISAGQISMLEVMALARPLIVTKNMATREYAAHGETVLFFEAGKDDELRVHIQALWNDREGAEQMGQRAQRTVLMLNEQQIDVCCKLLERCTVDIRQEERRQ